MLQKSPSGSLCPYYYKGGELHPLKYGNYGNDSQAFSAMIKAEENFILKSTSGRNVWIDLYDTALNKDQTVELSLHICNISQKIARLALVGCSRRVYNTIQKDLCRQGNKLSGSMQHFHDPEVAKDWLVGRFFKKTII